MRQHRFGTRRPREPLLDAAREMIASYRDEGREPPIGGRHAETITIDLAASHAANWSDS